MKHLSWKYEVSLIVHEKWARKIEIDDVEMEIQLSEFVFTENMSMHIDVEQQVFHRV